jgi:tripartite-type tricarboxylate transporter receptor subunit TctC
MNGLFTAAGTPAAVVNRLNHEVAQIVRRDEVKDRFATIGVETVGGSAESFASIVKSEMNKWGTLIKSAGIRAD